MTDMHKRLWIFLTLYLAGMAMSPLLASDALHAKKTFLYSFEEGSFLETEGQYEWQDQLPDFLNGGLAHRFDLREILFFSHSVGLEATQNIEAKPCPLYLLFQALLFYELS
jgi:hypothetical protein